MSSEATAQDRPFVHFGTADGLRQLVATDVLSAPHGTLWVATEGGLHRLEGDRFAEVPVDGRTGRHIQALAIGPDGEMWVATVRNLFEHRDGDWRAYGKADGLEPPNVTVARWHRGELWAGTAFGLYRWVDDRFVREVQVPRTRVRELETDRQGRLWAGSPMGLFVREEGDWARVSHESVYGLSGNPGGRGVWIAYRTRLEHRTPDEVLRRVPLREPGHRGTLRDLIVDRYGIVWAGTDSGVLRVDADRARLLDGDASFRLEQVNAVFEDREGGLWFAGTGGVANLPDRSFRIYRRKHGLPSNNVGPIVRTTDGRLWVGTLRGLAYKESDHFVPFDGLTEPVTSLAAAPDGSLWVGHASGLHRWTRTEGLRPDATWARPGMITSIARHPDGSIWIAGDPTVGLVRRTADGDESITIAEQTLLNPRLLIDRKGRVWVSGSEGLSVLAEGVWRTHDVDDGLARNDPYSMVEDAHGHIWFGYHAPSGVTRFNGQGFRTFTTADGLSTDRVVSLGADGDEGLWFGGARGVDRFDGRRFVFYGTEDGYPGPEANAGSFFADLDGSLWMGTTNGLARYRPDRAPLATAAPDVVLNHVAAGGAPVSPSAYIEASHIDLSATYRVRSRYRRHHIEVRSRLRGLSLDWEPVTGGVIQVDRLLPGSYALELEARRAPGPWHPVAVRSFEVGAPPWARAWVWWLALVPTLGLLGAALRIKLRRTQLINDRLRSMVDERTDKLLEASREADAARQAAETANRAKSLFLANMSHEMRTPLNAVLGMTSLLVDTPLDAEQSELALTAKRSSEALLSLVDEILDFSRIEAGHLSLMLSPVGIAELIDNALRVVAPRAHEQGVSLAYDLTRGVPPRVIADEGRLRQILLNLLVNAVKFTAEGEIGVRVTTPETRHLCIAVQDTGIGIPKEAQHRLFEPFMQVDPSTSRRHGEGTGLGLAISHRLVTSMGGRIEVDSTPGEGTVFYVHLPAEPARSGDVRAVIDASAIEGRRVAIVAPGPTMRSSLERLVTGWKGTAVVFERLPSFGEAPGSSADAIIVALLGWPRAVDIQPQIDAATFDKRKLVVIGGSTGRPHPALLSISEPVDPVRLLNALRRALPHTDYQEAAPTAASTSDFQADLGREHPLSILIVDDNRVNREVARRMLKRLGYEQVRCVEDGETAISEIHRDRPDLVFMDVQMPGMDGLETTRRLRKLPAADQPCIFALTAGVLDEDRRACADAGMDGFVAKPIQVSALVDALRACQRRKSETEVGHLPRDSALTGLSSKA